MNAKSFDQKADQLLIHIWLLTNKFNALLSNGCEAECNLSLQEIKAIAFLGWVGPSKMKALADHLKLAVSSTTALVDNLEVKNAVKRERSSEDRRVVILRLTEEGLRDYQMTVDAYKQFCRDILKALKQNEQNNLLELFDKIGMAYVK